MSKSRASVSFKTRVGEITCGSILSAAADVCAANGRAEYVFIGCASEELEDEDEEDDDELLLDSTGSNFIFLGADMLAGGKNLRRALGRRARQQDVQL